MDTNVFRSREPEHHPYNELIPSPVCFGPYRPQNQAFGLEINLYTKDHSVTGKVSPSALPAFPTNPSG